jgi:hypothetical protein
VFLLITAWSILDLLSFHWKLLERRHKTVTSEITELLFNSTFYFSHEKEYSYDNITEWLILDLHKITHGKCLTNNLTQETWHLPYYCYSYQSTCFFPSPVGITCVIQAVFFQKAFTLQKNPCIEGTYSTWESSHTCVTKKVAYPNLIILEKCSLSYQVD